MIGPLTWVHELDEQEKSTRLFEQIILKGARR